MCVTAGNITICGGPAPLLDKEPDDIDMAYRVRIPYPFDWREKLGKVVCDCETVIKWYRPWHGIALIHDSECAIEKHLRRYPGIRNFVERAGGTFAYSG